MKKFVFLTCLLFGIIVNAQQTLTVNYDDRPLKEVIQDLEKQTSFSFAFSDEVVTGKSFHFSATDIAIESLLEELTRQTRLIFEKVSEVQILISAPNNKISVCGYLFDARSREVLPFATIHVDQSTKGTTSDENGYFIVEDINASASLIVQYVGYQDKKLLAETYQNETCKNILLRPQVQPLSEVVVTGYLTKGVNKNSNGSLSLSNKDLGILPGLVEPDVFQSLQLVPGITSLDESASDIQIRGGSADQNLILYDNIKLYNTGHFFGMISTINPFVAKTTKVYKGGASPKYGDRISGVIDIVSETEIPQQTSGGLGINGTHGDAYLEAPLAKEVGLVLSVRRSYTDLLQTPTFDALAEKVFQNTKVVTNANGQIIEDGDIQSEIEGEEDFFFYDGSAKLLIQPSENDRIAISGMFTSNDLDFQSVDDENINADRLVVQNQGGSFSWEGTKHMRWHHAIKAYYSNFDSDYANSVTDDVIVEEENLRKNSVEELGLDVNIGYDLRPRHHILAGYQFSNTDVFFQLFRDEFGDADINPDDNDDIIIDPASRDFNEIREGSNKSHSLYAEYQYRPTNKGLVSLGVRGSHYSLVDDYFFEPRLNVEYPLSKSLRLKASAERRYQSISQLVEFEDVQLRLEDRIWTLSDGAEIPILKSTQLSGGFLIAAKGWTLDIDGYLKNIDGLTSFTNGFTSTSEEFSEGESKIIGVDFLLKKKIDNYRVWLGYTFNDIEYTFPEIQASAFPGNNDVTHNFNISNSLSSRSWDFSLGWSYRTGAPFTPADSFDASTGDIDFAAVNSGRLPDHHRLDASIRYKFTFKKNTAIRGSLGISFKNIYARQIPISVSYRVDEDPATGSGELNRIEQLSLGFTPNATLRIFF